MAKGIITLVRKWLTKLLWLVSIFVILFVLVVSVLKLILPYWLDDKEKIVELVEKQIGGEFDYQQLVVDWTRFRPTVYLEDLSWSSDDHRIQLSSSRNTIELNLWQSLIDGYLQTESVEINGVNLSYTIQELATEQDVNPLSNLSIDRIKLALSMYPEVLQQRKIVVRDLSLTVRHQGNSRTLVSPLLRFEKMGNERQVIIDTRSELFSSGRFVIESKGQPFASNSHINIYTALEDTDIKSLAQFLNLTQEFPVDLVNLKLWLTYEGEVPVAGFAQVDASGDESRIAELNGAIRFKSDENGFHLSSERFHLVERQVDQTLLDFDTQFLVDVERQDSTATWNVSADNFPISYLITSVSPFLSQDTLSLLNGTSPDGHIHQFQMVAKQSDQVFKPIKANIVISDLDVKEYETIPGFQIDYLAIKDEAGKWRINLETDDASLSIKHWLNNPVTIDSLTFNGLLSVEKTTAIEIDEFKVANPDLSINAEGLVTLFENNQGDTDAELALYAEAYDINIGEIHKYLPRQGMKQKTVDYLTMSLQGGTVDKAKFLLRGDLESFPYKDGTGQFYIEADVSDAVFKFHPEWPQADSLSAKAIFDNDEMLIVADSGNLLGSSVVEAKATIDSFSNEISMLVITADATVTNESYLALHQSSPLKEDIGKAITDFKINKPITSTVEITIPLGNDVPATIKGTIPLDGHRVSLKDYSIALNQVNGLIHFTEDGAYSENLRGSLWGNPFTIDVKVDDFTGDADLVKLDATSNFSVGKVFDSQKIQSPLSITGSSELVVRYRVDHQAQQSLIVRTDLKGTEIIGPDWLSKDRQQVADVLITLFEAAGQVKSRAIYRNTISSQLQFSSNNFNDIKGVVALGNLATTDIKAPQDGVAIRGEFNEIKSYDWINSLQFKKGGSFSWPQWIDHIDIKTPIFEVAGQKLHNVHLSDELLAGQYLRFKATAEEGKGSLTLYDDGRKHVVIDQLDIELQPFSKLSDTDIGLEKEDLYNWQLECASCRINGIDTGVLTLVTKQTEQGVTLQGDSKIQGLLSAYLEGSWFDDISTIKITFTSPNAGRLLERWGYGDGVRETQTNGSLNLSWQGGWHQFELAKSDGKLAVNTEQGVVRELSDRQARVFSLFSLQSLRRRLSLDFRDLFEDGFFYDSIDGKFTIAKGIVHSDAVVINGATAEVTISGYTNLVNNTVDQNVVVIPKLGSSLPLLAGWAIEPTTGLIMLLINKIFEPVLDVVVRIEYNIKGDLANPVVIEVDKKSKEIVVPDEELLEQVEGEPILETELIEQESTLDSEPQQQQVPENTDKGGEQTKHKEDGNE
jgi:uncharacterized protein (TIGR02099 family)